ncbi:MAG: hypothetical protein R3B70_22070 [Polyangiaceae bacterium]
MIPAPEAPTPPRKEPVWAASAPLEDSPKPRSRPEKVRVPGASPALKEGLYGGFPPA